VSVDTLIAFAQSPVVLNGKLGFGKHFDKTWAEVPIDYLQWMIRENEVSLRRDGKDAWDRDTLFTIDRLLRRQ
jgi:hypothetical protein